MSLVPVPSEQAGANCANCGAALVADQRYCLSCGHPASPVRLAFLDVLQSDEPRKVPGPSWQSHETIDMSPVGYAPVYPQQGAGGWLRRNSGLMSLLSVLLMCLIAGLLVGHWVTQNNKTPPAQVVKVEGLSGLGAAATATPTTPSATSTTPAETSTTPTTSKSSAKEEAQATKEAAAIEKVPLKKATKLPSAKLEKLSKSSGKKHQEEINSLGAQPIETG
jgi:hypothetical protein